MSLDKVSPKSPFIVKANTWNRFIDMTNGGKQKESVKKTILKNKNEINFCNTTEDVLPMYAVMDMQGELIPGDFETYLDGALPEVPALQNSILPPTVKARVCILQQPLAHNEVGKAIYNGVAKVKIKKETGLDESLPMRVIKIDGDNTQMAVTNRETPDDLLFHNSDYTLGVVHLGKYLMNRPFFVGILDCVPDTIAGRVKVVVKDYYSGKVYHIVGALISTYRQLTVSPPRPRSTAVIAQFTYHTGGLDYCEFQPFYSTDLEGIVKYNDEQTLLNNTVLGRRSSKDRIAEYYQIYDVPSNSANLINLWGQIE